MSSLGTDGAPPLNTVNAYANNVGNNFQRKLFIVFGSILLFLVFKNALFRDYNSETKSYLTSVGRTDVIYTIIPKTSTEIKLGNVYYYITKLNL